MKPILQLFITISVSFVSAMSIFAQGSLTPPAGAPAPTMKTLDQVEPRTPISAVPFTISASGSYYLTGNLAPAGNSNGITVSADNVTIDLNGFQLTGGPGATGITLGSSKKVVIKNGTISGWNNSGINGSSSDGLVVENIRASGNGSAGINAGTNAIVTSCTALTNTLTGIQTGTGSVVSHCTASGSTGATGSGIQAGNNSVMNDCVATNNTGAGGFGLAVGGNSTISHCVASGNNGTTAGLTAGASSVVTECTSSGNTGASTVGILVGFRCTVTRCAASGNGSDGIRTNSDCLVVGNNASSNLANGIYTTNGVRNRVEGNTAIGNTGNGIKVDAANNLIIRNGAANNGGAGGEFSVAASNAFAPVVTQANLATNTNPDANFDFD